MNKFITLFLSVSVAVNALSLKNQQPDVVQEDGIFDLACKVCKTEVNLSLLAFQKVLQTSPIRTVSKKVEEEFKARVCPKIKLFVEERTCRFAGHSVIRLLSQIRDAEKLDNFVDFTCGKMHICPEFPEEELLLTLGVETVTEPTDSCTMCTSIFDNVIKHAQEFTQDKPEEVMAHLQAVCEKIPFKPMKDNCNTAITELMERTESTEEKITQSAPFVCHKLVMCPKTTLKAEMCNSCKALVRAPLSLALAKTKSAEKLCDYVPYFLHKGCEDKAIKSIEYAQNSLDELPEETCSKMRAC